jgi:Pentapeptide repeats (8 copies)
MSNTISGAGIACIIAAIVGGGLKAFGIEIPVLNSIRRQLLLAAFGAVLVCAPLLNWVRLSSQATLEPNPEQKARVLATLPTQTVVQELATTRDPTIFAPLFKSAFVPVSWSNLDAVLQVDRILGSRLIELYVKSYNEETKENELKRLTEDEIKERDYLRNTIKDISSDVGPLLKGPRPAGQKLDLRRGCFGDCDWRGVNLYGANLDNFDMRSSNLKGADLGEVTSFQDMYMYRTAWWEAKRISPELLQYLLLNSPYEPANTYGPQEYRVSARDYEDSVARLKAGK